MTSPFFLYGIKYECQDYRDSQHRQGKNISQIEQWVVQIENAKSGHYEYGDAYTDAKTGKELLQHAHRPCFQSVLTRTAFAPHPQKYGK
jgi:hypothetical protein